MKMIDNEPIQGEASAMLSLLCRTLQLIDRDQVERCAKDEKWAELYWLVKRIYGYEI